MKKTFLTLCAGILIGLYGSTAAGAIASVSDKVEATITRYIYIVNGEEKTIDVDPIVIQGTSYLPTRAIANLLGYDVTYHAETSPNDIAKIEFTKTYESLTEETEYLLSQEAEQVNNSTEELIIEEQITEINQQIENYKKAKNSYRFILESEYASEIDKDRARKAQADYDAKITELEARKAELEAQLKTAQ